MEIRKTVTCVEEINPTCSRLSIIHSSSAFRSPRRRWRP
jgi:hypothetical protein